MINTRIEIISVVVDNSNPSYQNAIVLVYWVLVAWYDDMLGESRVRHATYFTPTYDETFKSIDEVNPELLATWIENTYGPNYNTLVQANIDYLTAQHNPPEGDNLRGRFFNQITNQWQ